MEVIQISISDKQYTKFGSAKEEKPEICKSFTIKHKDYSEVNLFIRNNGFYHTITDKITNGETHPGSAGKYSKSHEQKGGVTTSGEYTITDNDYSSIFFGKWHLCKMTVKYDKFTVY